MRIELPIVWVVVLNVMGWPVLQFGLAWLFTRLPESWFTVGNSGPGEAEARFYETVLRIRRWKDRLPDGAAWFDGGFRKAKLQGRTPDYLQRFIRETWRGELCHWCTLGCAPVFFLWNPLWADAVMIAYALAANLPCIAAQRYNRFRLRRSQVRRPRRIG